MSLFSIFRKKESVTEDPLESTRKLLDSYTPEERAYILESARADYEAKEADYQRKMDLYYQMTGRRLEEE